MTASLSIVALVIDMKGEEGLIREHFSIGSSSLTTTALRDHW